MSYAAPPKRWFIRIFGIIQTLLYKVSGSRLSNTVGGDDICFLETVGAKTGKTRFAPLMYVPFNGGVLLVASVGGTPKNPSWYWNILKSPVVKISHRGSEKKYRARVAHPDERPSLWRTCVETYPTYGEYETRTQREIPVLICEPLEV